MTADRLDAETEARIREACPRHRYDDDFRASCWCDIQRAAILAEREARPSADEVLAIRCGKHYMTLPIVNMPDGKECAICLRDDERKDADYLAKSLRIALPYVEGIERQFYAGVQDPVVAEIRGHISIAKAALAAHDKRRGR